MASHEPKPASANAARSNTAALPARKRSPAPVSTAGFDPETLAFGKIPPELSQAAFRPDLAAPPTSSQAQPVQARAATTPAAAPREASEASSADASGQPGEVVQASLLGGIVGGVVGGVGGMLVGGPLDAVAGAAGGAAIGHALTWRARGGPSCTLAMGART